MESKKLFKLDKDTIIFNIDTKQINNIKDSELLSSDEINITNLTSEFLAFRTKTTKNEKEWYTVDPNYFILRPKLKQKIKINYHNNHYENKPQDNLSFKFEGFILPKEIEKKIIKNIFEDYRQNKNKFNSYFKIIDVNFCYKIIKNKNLKINDSNDNIDIGTKITENIKSEKTSFTSGMDIINNSLNNENIVINLQNELIKANETISLQKQKIKDLENKLISNEISEDMLKKGLEQLKIISVDSLNNELLKLEFKKNNANVGDTIRFLTNEDNIKKLKKELEKNKNINKKNNKDNNDILIESLNKKIKEMEEEIKLLILKLKNKNQNINRNQIMCINFTSNDQKINYAIPCIDTDIFAEVEERLYREFTEYRETNNCFLVNGRQILRFKTVAENKIAGFPVLLVTQN